MKMFEQRGMSRTILKDLSKAFDCILHDLLIAEVAAYSFNHQSLRIMENFLSNRQQRMKMITPLVVAVKLYMEFHKDQFWIP